MGEELWIDGTPGCIKIAAEAEIILITSTLQLREQTVQRLYMFSYPHWNLQKIYKIPDFETLDFSNNNIYIDKKRKPKKQEQEVQYERICVCESGKYAVLGERNAVSREMIINLTNGKFVHKSERSRTVTVKQRDRDLFVSFTQQERNLWVYFLACDQDKNFEHDVLQVCGQLRLGRTLIGPPLVLHTEEHIAFIQVNLEGQVEVCILDITGSRASIQSRSLLTSLNIPSNHKVKGFFLDENSENIWIYHEDISSKCKGSGACLVKPNLTSPKHSNVAVQVTGTITSQKGCNQLLPNSLKEDFFRLIIQSCGRTIALDEWKDYFISQYKELFELWLNKQINTYKLNNIMMLNTFNKKNAIICCSESNSIYVLDWKTGFLNYKIKFKDTTISHVLVHEGSVIVTFEDGTIIELEMFINAKGCIKSLELVNGELPEGTVTSGDSYYTGNTPRPRAQNSHPTSKTCTIL